MTPQRLADRRRRRQTAAAMADPRDLATALFGDEPEELAGWWACRLCDLRRPGHPCEHDPQSRRWWIPATHPTAGAP